MLCACAHRDKLEFEEYSHWIAKPEHGLVQEKRVNGYILKVKYLPWQYMVRKEMLLSGARSNFDSIASFYKSNYNFLLSITPDINGASDSRNIMFDDIEKFEDYKQRVFDVNFKMEDFVRLKLSNGVVLSPSIYNTENTYGLNKDLNFNLVFSPNTKNENMKIEDIDLILEDYIFSTGINHFIIKTEDLDNLPILI